METWLIYAIASIFFGGFFSFGMKIIAQRDYNPSYASFISYITLTIAAFIYYIVNNQGVDAMIGIYMILVVAFFNTLFYFGSTLTRIESLKNIDTTIFFPLYKMILPIIVTLVSYFIFKEELNGKELIGVVLGITIPLILITKRENEIQRNLKLGVILVIITGILASISGSLPKIIHTQGYNVDLFILVAASFGTVISFMSYSFGKRRVPNKVYNQKHLYLFSIALGCTQFGGFLTYVYATGGNLAIAVTVNSFSLLIPIILSVIFYGEEMTYKKAFVIFLSIVSIVLFI